MERSRCKRDGPAAGIVLTFRRAGDGRGIGDHETAGRSRENRFVIVERGERSGHLDGHRIGLALFVKGHDLCVVVDRDRTIQVVAEDDTRDIGGTEARQINGGVRTLADHVVDVAAGAGVRGEVDISIEVEALAGALTRGAAEERRAARRQRDVVEKKLCRRG